MDYSALSGEEMDEDRGDREGPKPDLNKLLKILYGPPTDGPPERLPVPKLPEGFDGAPEEIEAINAALKKAIWEDPEVPDGDGFGMGPWRGGIKSGGPDG